MRRFVKLGGSLLPKRPNGAALNAWKRLFRVAWRYARAGFSAIRRPLSTASASSASEHEVGIMRASGTGVQVELRGNCLYLRKGGAFGFFVALLGYEGGFAQQTIRVSDISALEVDRAGVFLHYMRISYPGSPHLTGDDWLDMLSENAIILSWFDNRALYGIKEEIERRMGGVLSP
jgi:hypothetical protein